MQKVAVVLMTSAPHWKRIYRLMLPYTDRFYLTLVHARAQGDAWFPEYDSNKYQEVARTDHPADERHAFAYSFVTLERR